MTETAQNRAQFNGPAPRRRLLTGGRLFWLALFALTWAASSWSFALYKALDARWIIRFPKAYQLPLEGWLSDFTNWLIEDLHFGLFSFRDLTRFIAALIEMPYDLVRALLLDGFARGQGQQAVEIVPALSWIVIIFAFVALAKYARGWGLAALVGACFAYLAIFGQWQSAMVTLASVLIAVPMGALGGLMLGITAYRSARVEKVLRPILDLMQTVPVFAYLVPILVLFGFGPVAALIATVIYAMPPMVRNTTVALQSVPKQLIEAGRMMGCKPRQLMWKVLVPAALPSIMVGVNQVIMLTLNMVIIASMIGAGGLGYDVLTSLRRLDIGGGVEAGFAIVVMAIALDRLSQAFATQRLRPQADPALPWPRRHPLITAVIGLVILTYLAGLIWPILRVYPADLALTTGRIWEETIGWINVHFFDAIDAVKTLLLSWLLVPVKQFFAGIPWALGIAVTGLAAGRLGGWRLGLMAALMMAFIAATGLWHKAMTTVYLTTVSVFLASLIGIPLGIWAGQSARANTVIGAAIDTLQTLPSFVYLIPVVMLFRVGDFSALIAMVLYAVAPAVRYAAHGIRSVDPELIEAGQVAGCTKWQLLTRVKLPLAAPSLLLGLNQTIMLALSMLVITALVGTRDLGQEVYIALTKAHVGKGIVAGLCVAFLAIIADRVVTAMARRSKQRLGLE